MKKLLLLLLINIFTSSLYPQYKVEGGVGKPFEYSENLSGSGVEKIYLLNTLSDATITYTSSAVSVDFYRYKESLANKELIPDSEVSYDETTYIVSNLRDGYGYLVEENGSPKAAIWIIDYSLHLPQLTSIEAIEGEDKCEYLKLYVTKSDELSFSTNGGAKKQIPRKYTISYKNKEWNEKTRTFDLKDVALSEREIGTEVLIDAPLMDTEFILRGDQFAKHFGLLQEVSSVIYSSVAVEAHMYAEQSSICADSVSVDFSISESWIEAPNYFSPDDSPGSNDEFKVAYKSIVKFRCTIFNRWGTKLYQWTDPSKGWDGKYKGKYVNTGVYYYIIEAQGSDGKKYKLGGDINILRSR